jgi:hypothetical protein
MTRYFALAILLTSASAQAQTPTTEELWKVIQQQQAEIDALKSKDSATDQELALTREQVNATGAAVDSIARNRSTGSSWTDTTQLGGYGEMNYNELSAYNSAIVDN